MACSSSSIIGVSSIYHKNPSQIEHLSRKITTPTTTTTTTSATLLRSTDKTHFTSLISTVRVTGAGGCSGFVTSATATPNSILSDKAFKGLGVFDENSSSVDDSDTEYDDGSEIENKEDDNDDDELAITKLGLPKRLVESLEKREITRLFPIQVIFFIFNNLFILNLNIDLEGVCFSLFFGLFLCGV